MSIAILLWIYALVGAGFSVAAEESEPDKWFWASLLILFLFWPAFVAYAIGKMKV